MSFEYPEDAEILDNLGVAPSISWELDYWERTVELSTGAETLRFSYDQTGFVCLEWRDGERRLLSLSLKRSRGQTHGLVKGRQVISGGRFQGRVRNGWACNRRRLSTY